MAPGCWVLRGWREEERSLVSRIEGDLIIVASHFITYFKIQFDCIDFNIKPHRSPNSSTLQLVKHFNRCLCCFFCTCRVGTRHKSTISNVERVPHSWRSNIYCRDQSSLFIYQAFVKVRTFGAQICSKIFDQRLSPRLQLVHQMHHILAFGCEAGDCLATNDGLACGSVDNAAVDCGTVAALNS